MPSRPPSSRSIVPSTLSAVSSRRRDGLVDRHLAADLAERAAPALAVRRAVAGDVGDVLRSARAAGRSAARPAGITCAGGISRPRSASRSATPKAGCRPSLEYVRRGRSSSVAPWRPRRSRPRPSPSRATSPDEGVDAVLDNIQERGGLGGITPAFSYHAARDIFPHNPRRKVQAARSRRALLPARPDRS